MKSTAQRIVAGPAILAQTIPAPAAGVVMRMAVELSHRPCVHEIGLETNDQDLDVWVFVTSDDIDAVEEIYRIGQRTVDELAAFPGDSPALNLHVIPPNSVPATALPQLEYLYTR